MFLSRQTTDKNVDMGLCYSILQKCVRRCLLDEAMYYGRLVYHDGTPNSLRKRLIQYCLEDMARLDLALEILDAPDNKLFDFLQIVTINKKSRLSEWFLTICGDYLKFKIEDTSEEIKKGIEILKLESKKKYIDIRNFIGTDLSKLYTYMKKDKLVWVMKILWDRRDELKYILDRNVTNIKGKPFEEIPKYVYDKHVLNGTPGLRFFFENGAIIFNKLYESEYEPYEIEAKNIYYHNESDTNKLNKDVPVELYKVGFRNIIQCIGLDSSFFCTKFSNSIKYFIREIDSSQIKNYKLTEHIKKIIKFPNLNTDTIEVKGKTDTKIYLVSESLDGYKQKNGIKFSDFFGPDRDMMLDQKNLIMGTIFKNIVCSKDFSEESYILHDNIVYSINDDSQLPNTYDIDICPSFDVEDYWDIYMGSFRKEKIINELKLWKKRIKLSTDLEYKNIIYKRIKKIIKFIKN